MKNEVYFEIVISKLLESLHIDDYSKLARELKMSPSAFANRKKSGSLPYEAIIKLCKELDLSLDQVFSELPSKIKETINHEIDADLFIKVSNKLNQLVSGVILTSQSSEKSDKISKIRVTSKDVDLLDFSILVYSTYNNVLNTFDRLLVCTADEEKMVIDEICNHAANDFLIRLKLDVVKKGHTEIKN